MAYSNVLRNLRDGEIVISDGTSGNAKTCTVLCEDGGLSWTEKKNWSVNLCRGTLDEDSIREGDDTEVTLSVTASWGQLIQGASITSSTDPNVIYEIVNNRSAAYTSVSTGHYALKWTFTVVCPEDPGNGKDEIITFARVRKDSLTCAEGKERNTIQFSGIDNETVPTIARDS